MNILIFRNFILGASKKSKQSWYCSRTGTLVYPIVSRQKERLCKYKLFHLWRSWLIRVLYFLLSCWSRRRHARMMSWTPLIFMRNQILIIMWDNFCLMVIIKTCRNIELWLSLRPVEILTMVYCSGAKVTFSIS